MIFTRLRREALPIHTNSDATPAVQNTLAPRQCPAFPLLKLPAELRNLVYYHFLASEDGIITITEGNIKARAPILLTCRQVRGEAYYTLSRYFRFRIECGFGDGVRAARWLGTLGSKPRVYEIIIDLAADLRYHFASSHGHAVLQRVSSRAVSFTRQRKYDKRYKKVLSDHDAIHGYMTEGMNAPYSKGSIGRQLCAPPHCVQLRLDEWRYLDRITNALRNRGYEIKDDGIFTPICCIVQTASPEELIALLHRTSIIVQTTASPKASTGSPLLDAPAEIRNNIYRLVVVAHDQPVDITPHDLLVRKALIDTCKQIREEAKDIIISENTFHVVCGSGDGFLAAKWIKSLCSKARMIKKLEITFKVSDITKATFLAVEAAGNGLLPRSSPGFSKAYEDMRRAHAQMGLTYGPELQALAEAVSSSIAAGNMVREALRVERISQQPSHIIDHEGFCLWFMSSLLRDLGTDKGDAAVRRRANKLAEYRALIG